MTEKPMQFTHPIWQDLEGQAILRVRLTTVRREVFVSLAHRCGWKFVLDEHRSPVDQMNQAGSYAKEPMRPSVRRCRASAELAIFFRRNTHKVKK